MTATIIYIEIVCNYVGNALFSSLMLGFTPVQYFQDLTIAKRCFCMLPDYRGSLKGNPFIIIVLFYCLTLSDPQRELILGEGEE